MKVKSAKIIVGGLVAALSMLLLAACGDSAGTATNVTPPDKACAVVEQKKPDTNETFVFLDLDNSPSYCKNVTKDYKAAMQWYQGQVRDNRYGPNMSAELENYYTGQLLQETRASLFYNTEAGRVVVGKWKPEQEQINGPNWSKDGLTATLVVKPGEYEMLTFPAGQPDKATVQQGSPYESWLVSLVYDAKAERWKISKAQTIITKPDKAQG